VRLAGAVIREFRPFGRGWWLLAGVSVVLMFGAGGGTPNGTIWLTVKFAVLGVLLASLLLGLLSIAKDEVVRRTRLARRSSSRP
jgi:hypothetical protein